ncbi:toll-like receptor 1 [Littorina saxatilis]|uniref:toll-like receptor 1 n=1 Tax=Littorina saxatilis TaxID=31220 RepID=UPI0038B4B50F
MPKLAYQGNVLTATSLQAALHNVSSIEVLNIQGNRLTTVTQSTFPSLFLQHVKEIDLSNNRFACTCELLWFRKWLDDEKTQRKIKITGYPNHGYICNYPLHMRRVRLDDFHPTEDECNPLRRAYSLIGIVGGVVVVAAVVVSVVVYRYRWELRFYLYRLRRLYVQVNTEGTTECFRYDLYLAHSADDLDWINEELLPLLEREHGLAVFVEERDTVGGAVAAGT